MLRNRLLKHAVEGKVKASIYVKGISGRRRK